MPGLFTVMSKKSLSFNDRLHLGLDFLGLKHNAEMKQLYF